jgi:outer membrane protein TolC
VHSMKLFGILLAWVGTVGVTVAQTNGTALAPTTGLAGERGPATIRRMSLEDCIELALKDNIDLRIERYNPKIDQYALDALYGAYYDPLFDLSGEHSHSEAGGGISGSDSFRSSLGGLLPWGTSWGLVGQTAKFYDRGDASASATVSVTQPLLKNLWIDNARLSIKVAKNRIKQSEQVLKLRIMETVTSLEQAYYLLIYDRANVVVQQNAVDLADRLVAENKKRLEVGSLAPLDLQSAESQAAQSRAAVLQAQTQLATQERIIKRLITDHFLNWAEVTIEPTGTLTAPAPLLNLQESWRKGLTQRPELVQAKLDLESQGLRLKFDRNQLLPDISVSASFGYNGGSTDFNAAYRNIQSDRPSYTYGGSLSVPLTRANERNTFRSHKATEQQLLLSLKGLQEQIMVEIDDDIGRIRAAYDRVQATKSAREYAEAALAAEQKKLESGKSTTYTVLQMQRDLTARRGDEIQALNAYNTSISELSLDEGSTLERLSIKFEVK